MAKFKCNQSGNVIEFLQEHEIAEMRKHGGYTEVVEAAPVIKQTTSTSSSSKKAVKTNESSVNGDDSNSSN